MRAGSLVLVLSAVATLGCGAGAAHGRPSAADRAVAPPAPMEQTDGPTQPRSGAARPVEEARDAPTPGAAPGR